MEHRYNRQTGRRACGGFPVEFVHGPHGQVDFPPYPGELGKRIFENVSKEAWRQWLEHQKMLVNESQLSLADKRARDYLAQQMEKYFFSGGADVAAGYVPPSQKQK